MYCTYLIMHTVLSLHKTANWSIASQTCVLYTLRKTPITASPLSSITASSNKLYFSEFQWTKWSWKHTIYTHHYESVCVWEKVPLSHDPSLTHCTPNDPLTSSRLNFSFQNKILNRLKGSFPAWCDLAFTYNIKFTGSFERKEIYATVRDREKEENLHYRDVKIHRNKTR